MDNHEGFDAIKIYWMDVDSIVFGPRPGTHVCFEVIPLSDVADNGIPKIMEIYYPRYSKTPMFVRPFKIEFVNNK